ncbi:SAF domain-containing protein [Streptomyces sp. NPDC058746]|uniref:SAF domain-containing protein n=1 Tax=Streptomyces sp. NPDC058746 TaxID=3346622 RepID=UPI00368DDCF1
MGTSLPSARTAGGPDGARGRARGEEPWHGPLAEGAPVGARRRWRPGLVALGAAGAITCAAGASWLLAEAGERAPVLTVARPVAAGQVIEAGDLGEVRLGFDDAKQVVPATDRNGVVGRRAVVPLVPGALLAPVHVGSEAVYPPSGKAQIVVAVDAVMLPPGLVAGQRVAVLQGAPLGARTAGEVPETNPLVGVVSAVREAESASGKGAVTLLVDIAAVRRAAQFEDPRLAVLGGSDKEVP